VGGGGVCDHMRVCGGSADQELCSVCPRAKWAGNVGLGGTRTKNNRREICRWPRTTAEKSPGKPDRKNEGRIRAKNDGGRGLVKAAN